ncbi:caspase-8-like [Gambusia affinis]|uniref:caspase-8-like n=1 Tax=Gambusia affinis TaxID=33528 RepID=UPI001CDC8B63|nr:caspase-8-like [Gambusia affinis]
MAAKEILTCNKTKLIDVLCGDYQFILNKVQEKKLITLREYNNLKSINKEHVEGHVVEMVDKVMNKGEKTCQNFLELLQTDDIAETYPDLENMKLHDVLLKPVQATSPHSADRVPETERLKKDEVYELKSEPVGLCLIINNENFHSLKQRRGTYKDAESLAEVFSWLGFKVLMCKDQTRDKMEQILKVVASSPANTRRMYNKVLLKDVEEDSAISIPEESDFLAISTVEDYVSFRHPIDGSWFIQSVCKQLKLHCPSGEDFTSILHRVNHMVGQQEGSVCVGLKKQVPEVKFTLRKKLVLSPRCT